MSERIQTVEIAPGVVLGGARPLIIAGPCVIESAELCLRTAAALCAVCARLDLPYVFKSSFDKANRTALGSFRSLGFEEALAILARVRAETGAALLTDIHESPQAAQVAAVVDVLQIPAFLCRQTDLLLAAGATGKAVNIKKGQFMAPEDMGYAVEKTRSTGNQRVFLTERGSSFGYHNLVVDMRALPIMRQFCPVVFDVTHSVQTPGGAKGASGGQRQFAPHLARAAAAAGVDGFFIETHPDPDRALSDGPNSIPLAGMEAFLRMILRVWEAAREDFGEWGEC